MKTNMADLLQITESLLQVVQTKMHQISTEESSVRLALSDLEERRSFKESGSDAIILKTLGADIKWQIWVDRKRRTLQQKLVIIMVHKAKIAEELKYAFGKNQAASKLASRQAKIKMRNNPWGI